jgi:pimeloyl-ACP methyl ester carboxylesterase
MISGWANLDGCVDWAIRWLNALALDSLPPWLHEGYAERSPDGPEHLPVVAAKLIEEWRSQPQLALTDLTQVKAPTLVLIGDDDMITPAYAAAMVGALPEAQLAVVPGTSHGITFEKTDLVNRLIFDFLAADQVKKVFTPHELGVE